MKLETTVRFHFPKSARLSDEIPSTSDDALKTPEVMAAIGLAQAKAGFGMAVFFGKVGVSQADKNTAVKLLMRLAARRMDAWKTFKILDARKRLQLVYLISSFAYETFCRTAEVKGNRCKSCRGRGTVIDPKASKEAGRAIEKPCSRCAGKGFRPLLVSQLMSGIIKIHPDFSRRTFFRRVKPIIEELVTECHKQEAIAEEILKSVSK